MSVHLRFEDREITADEGQTVAAALVRSDIDSWRVTRGAGRPRGLFCGIGVCFDCLVRIDGEDGQRACLVEVAEGMQVDRHGA
jgi:predicted molibdopterin-dependent oxidoreductase YjgC